MKLKHIKNHYWIGTDFIGRYRFIKLQIANVKNFPSGNKVISFFEMLSSKYRDKLSEYWIDMFNNDIVIERF